MQTKGIKWPAILVYSGDEELGYIDSFQEWNTDSDLKQAIFQHSDRLIDSNGLLFRLDCQGLQIAAIPLKQQFSLDQINQLVKGHLSQAGNCCVSKFSSVSIAEAFSVVKLSV